MLITGTRFPRGFDESPHLSVKQFKVFVAELDPLSLVVAEDRLLGFEAVEPPAQFQQSSTRKPCLFLSFDHDSCKRLIFHTLQEGTGCHVRFSVNNCR